METHKKRSKRENFKGKENTKPFTTENQPNATVKSQGWQKKRFTRQVIREFLEGKFNLSPQMKQQFQEKFGIDPDKVAVGSAIMMQQVMLSMGGGSTARQAAEFLFNQGYGQPKQEIENTGNLSLTITRKLIGTEKRD